MLLEQIERRQKDLIALRDRVLRAKRYGRAADNTEAAKTIGVRIPEKLRARLIAAQSKHDLSTYTATVGLCIELGAEVMELSAKDSQR